jgi:hypothetical protein
VLGVGYVFLEELWGEDIFLRDPLAESLNFLPEGVILPATLLSEGYYLDIIIFDGLREPTSSIHLQSL